MADVQMKGITCCADCAYYSTKKHKCTRGYKEEGKATDHFYKDCPLPDVRSVVRGRWVHWEYGPYCSNCDGYPPTRKRSGHPGETEFEYTKFCPNCGADMREVSNE